jgi:DNA-binding NarL/FixJ family response regulator
MNEQFAVDGVGQGGFGSYQLDKPVSKVLVADDHESVRHGVRELIRTQRAFEICGEATDGREAVVKARQLKPDVVVIDVSMPELNGIDATRQIIKDNPSVEVLVLTMYESEQIVDQILNAGARGYLLKSDVAYDLLFAIGSLSHHRPFFTSKVASMVLQGYLENSARAGGFNAGALTAREREVVQLIAEGKSNKEVAVIQGIEVKTAETHRANLMRKLGLHSVCELVHYAVRNQIIKA